MQYLEKAAKTLTHANGQLKRHTIEISRDQWRCQNHAVSVPLVFARRRTLWLTL
jgi:hypothetical protein